MIGNMKNSPELSQRVTPETPEVSAFLYVEQLRVLFAKQPESLAHLDMIAEKLKRVSDSVQSIISGMLRSEIARIQWSSVSSAAAIMAANEEKFQIAA